MKDTNRDLPRTFAAVDLGSNSFHMLVARLDEGVPVVVDRLREMIRLASGLTKSRNLSREARDRALDCMRRFGQRVRHMPPGNVRAVGTNTLRSARNSDEFLMEAETALGHPVETISGIEEARLIYLGVSQSQSNPTSRRLVLDIGGGSTELIIGVGPRPILMESLYMGCVSMSRSFFGDGEITADLWSRAELKALQELEPIRSRYRELGWDEATGASGTVRAISSVIGAAGWSKSGITLKSLKRLRDACIKAGHVKRLRMEGLSAQRRPVFVGGVVVLLAAFDALGIDRMTPSEGALREGLLYDLIGRTRDEDIRHQSVEGLADRYHVDWKQADRVECTALQLLNQVAEKWDLASRELRQLVSWAAKLHEVGLDIAHANYHKHGEYIVAQSNLFGFTLTEQKLLATLIRAHRRKFPSSVIHTLPRGRARKIERLAVLCRLAVVLHRSRTPVRLPEPSLEVDRKLLKLRFPDGWLEGQPLTRGDLLLEADYLRSAGYTLEFE